jgi:hypothetical protein
MKFLFENESFSFETLRTAGYAAYGGADLGEVLVTAVAIPFEGTLLPGYLFRPDDSGEPRPTLIYHGGYDSVLEEAYFAAAAGAVRRGYM